MRRLRVLIAVAGVVAVAACGNNGDDNNDDTTAVPDNGSGSEADADAPLFGTHWQLDRVAVNDESTETSDDVAAYVVFDENEIGGNTGCNSFGGDIESSEDGSLTLGPVIATKRACTGELGDIDMAMLQVLHDEVSVDIAGERLTLTNTAGDTLEFHADDDPDLGDDPNVDDDDGLDDDDHDHDGHDGHDDDGHDHEDD
ncbi:META domain-containing protein [Phytoactinopolyspora limicola]|uniref:META domain-containing protein n=1 Tax=Phytoactinopolyspora limicola TaxID=2715536 RepID=UPI00140C8CD0|nr:META domain-containing protein [Phytoactinopolyspora limicola]